MIFLAGGENSISCDHGSILNLMFTVDENAPDGSYHITLTSGHLGDSHENPIQHHHMRGKFFIPSPPPVSIVCTPVSDTSLVRGDTLSFNTTLTNHSWEGVTASVFMYGTVTPQGMNPFLVVDTTYVYIPRGERVSSITEIEVPQNAPLVHYEFTGYVCEVDTTYDTDTFGFHVSDTLGIMWGGGIELASSDLEWKLLSGWFGGQNDQERMSQVPELSTLPRTYSLSQNFPNPFNPTTEILYTIPEYESEGIEVAIIVYNIRGQMVKIFNEGVKQPGRYSTIWDGRNDLGQQLGSGIYLYQIRAGKFKTIKKMVMMK
jgi:hypothetical protein